MRRRSSAASKQLIWVASLAAVTSVVVTGVFLYALPYVRPELAPYLRMQGSRSAPAPIALPAPTDIDLVASSSDPLVAVVKRAQPAVVSVSVEALASPELLHKLIAADWVDPTSVKGTGKPEQVSLGGGSGFFVTSDGMLVTNRHVVDNQYVKEAEAVRYDVILHDGATYQATLVASDPVLDLAFLKVQASGLPFLTLGDSDSVQLGQSVIAIGNALDQFRNSVTAGIISGLDRRIVAGDDGLDQEVIEEAIQTDAAINVGNSGGPLIDMRGHVIGVNTAVSDSGQLLGFALPSSVIKRSLESVKRYGRVTRPYLGVRYVMVDEAIALSNKLQVGHGALVAPGEKRGDLAVSPGSPAEKAGIREGDVIMSIGGHEVNGDRSIASYINRYSPGDAVPMRLNRGGKQMDVSVTLGEFPTDTP